MSAPHSQFVAACLVIALLALFAGAAEAELFEWIDDEGRVHYTNEPRPGAQPVGLAPIALEPEDESVTDERPSDRARRDRLKRQRAERWVDSQDQLPTTHPTGSPAPNQMLPAPPAAQADDVFERACQAEHGMPCLQFEAWLRSGGFDCEAGPPGAECRTHAKKALQKKARDKARRRLEREDAARAAR